MSKNTYSLKENMTQSKICLLAILSLFLIVTTSTKVFSTRTQNQRIKNLRAFAKLYGYIKYFHPSDPASEIDWDKFAIYGCGRVKNARNIDELKTILEDLYGPIAPTAQLYLSQEKPKPLIEPDQHTDADVVAWQHLGVGLGGSNIYRSIRINRENIITSTGHGFGTATQALDAQAYRGKKIKLNAYVRTNVAGSGNQGQLWLRVDRESKQVGFFDNMRDRPIKSDEWSEYEIAGDVADDAIRIVFGCFLKGMGQLWTDEFNLQVEQTDGEWRPIPINNPGFELEDNGKPAMWEADSPGYTYRLAGVNPYEGDISLLIENMGSKYTGTLFNKAPEIGEVFNKELCEGLFCQVPLALPGDDEIAHGVINKEAFIALSSQLEQIELNVLTADNQDVRLADIVIGWNVFQHFYPYFDVIKITDWDEMLTSLLAKALTNHRIEDFYNTLRLMVTMIHDGHGAVYHKISSEHAGFPFLVDWVGNKAVIIFSKDTENFKVGDIIISIDGTPAHKMLTLEAALISGSGQWKRVRAAQRFGQGKKGTCAKIVIMRGEHRLEINATRDNEAYLTEPNEKRIEEIEENIYYVNLDKVDMPEISDRMTELANAKGVIFDLRGYPKNNHDVISHLLTDADTSGEWMRTPRTIYPDRENPAGYMSHGWHMPVKKPHIKGKVVFITDGRTISYAESYMGFIEHYKLADIVGQPTAGTNGNVNAFSLPGDFRITWTGMKVVKHDGSQHHLVGILPTVPVERTIEGIREGRDEFLEKALEIIRKSL
jgi:hypothetical protein